MQSYVIVSDMEQSFFNSIALFSPCHCVSGISVCAPPRFSSCGICVMTLASFIL